VREAQRTYQKRKDNATASDKRRADKLLQVLANLSFDVEALLQTASKAGAMQRDDDISKSIQQLWKTYDGAINSPFVQPELRLQQIKNDQRLSDHGNNGTGETATASHDPPRDEPAPVVRPMQGKDPTPLFNSSAVSFELIDFEETTVAQPYQRVAFARMGSKSIYEVVKERQAALKEADRPVFR
jgi:hypothetical protein